MANIAFTPCFASSACRNLKEHKLNCEVMWRVSSHMELWNAEAGSFLLSLNVTLGIMPGIGPPRTSNRRWPHLSLFLLLLIAFRSATSCIQSNAFGLSAHNEKSLGGCGVFALRRHGKPR